MTEATGTIECHVAETPEMIAERLRRQENIARHALHILDMVGAATHAIKMFGVIWHNSRRQKIKARVQRRLDWESNTRRRKRRAELKRRSNRRSKPAAPVVTVSLKTRPRLIGELLP